MLIAAGRFQVVCQVLEDQALIQRTEGSGEFTEVVRRANDQAVRLTDGIQNGRQAVPADAVTLVLFFFASKAGNAAGILFQPEQVKPFDHSACGLCTFCRFRDQRICIPALSRTCIDNNNLFRHDVSFFPWIHGSLRRFRTHPRSSPRGRSSSCSPS